MNERTNERTFDLDFSSLSRNRTVGFDNVQRPRSFTDCFTSGTPHSVKVQMQDDDENKALRCSTKSCWKNKRSRVCVHTLLSSCVPKESREPESSGKANETEISVDCAGVERDRY